MGTDEPHISLTLLGSFGLRIDGRYCPPLPRKAQALVGLLALQRGRSLARETAVAMIWGRAFAGEGCHSLRQTLAAIRQQTGTGLVQLARGVLALRRDGVAVDVPQFEALAGSADRGELARCAALYRGEFLENVTAIAPGFDEWLAVERIRLAAIAAEVMQQLALSHAEAGEFDAAVAAARRVVALDELREDGHHLLISILDRCGRRAEALRHSDMCTRILTPTPRRVPAPVPAIPEVSAAAMPEPRRGRWWLGGAVALACLGAVAAPGGVERVAHIQRIERLAVTPVAETSGFAVAMRRVPQPELPVW